MLPTAANADVAELLRQDSDWRLPPLWRSEFRQVLLKVVRAEATGGWAPGSCAGHRYGLLHVRRRIRRTGTAAQLHAADLRSQVAAAFSGSCQETRPIGSAPQRHHRAIQDCTRLHRFLEHPIHSRALGPPPAHRHPTAKLAGLAPLAGGPLSPPRSPPAPPPARGTGDLPQGIQASLDNPQASH